jgi:hypothetical protein
MQAKQNRCRWWEEEPQKSESLSFISAGFSLNYSCQREEWVKEWNEVRMLDEKRFTKSKIACEEEEVEGALSKPDTVPWRSTA